MNNQTKPTNSKQRRHFEQEQITVFGALGFCLGYWFLFLTSSFSLDELIVSSDFNGEGRYELVKKMS
jgi:hypothetical protein